MTDRRSLSEVLSTLSLTRLSADALRSDQSYDAIDVRAEGNTITSIRRWLGIPVRVRRMQRQDFYRFEKNTHNQTQNGKNVRYFSVRGIDKNARELVLGEGFRGEAGADAAIRFLAKELRLEERKAGG